MSATTEQGNTAPRTTVHRSTSPTCHRCSTPLRLHASIQTGACCCCRGRCFADVGYGCLACGALLPDETLRLCLRCQITVGDVRHPASSTVTRST